MPRPGFVLEVDERTPPLLVHRGEGFELQKFPLGTRVVYPPDPLPGVRDVTGAIRDALLHPLDFEQLPELAARKGVDDVRLIVANSLHRRMTASEIKRVVGERVFRSFWPDGLKNFDAEEPNGLVHLGRTDRGEDVEVSKRVADSDLLVYVNINLVAMDGGHKSASI